jgi:ATP-dependent DNA helicase RecG
VKIIFELTGGDIKFQNEGLNGGLNSGLNGGLNEGQRKVFLFIQENKGIKAKDISTYLNIPVNTIEKHIKVLINNNLIERRGSKKTGGYYAI